MLALIKSNRALKTGALILSFLVFLVTVSPTFLAAQAEKVKVPAGTSVTLRFTDVITPEKYKVGDNVTLAVVNNVTIDGKVVIKAGASARGEVIMSQDRNLIGIPAKIGVSLKSVDAVDGNSIPISASKISEGKNKMVLSIGLSLVCCILFGLMKGGVAYIESGTIVDAITTTTVDVGAE